MNITAKTKICMIIGDPVEHSLSPQIHNAGYKALGIDDKFVYIGCLVTKEKLADFIKGVKSMQIQGVGVKTPHKIEIMQYLDEIDETAKKIGAVNTVVNERGSLKGYNTDWIGVVSPLEKIVPLNRRKVGLIGAGGAARAAAYGVCEKGADLTIFNRTYDKARSLAEEFGVKALSLQNFDEINNMEIIINATSIGLPPHENEVPVASKFISSDQIVYDLVYSLQGSTKFINDAKEKRAKVLTGIDMLLSQGYAQFKLFTNYDAPEKDMKNFLLEYLKYGKN